ncbi:aldose epimerase family protein [Celeribacter litoreus]|uniref:aldose epimerase family protein n=1 Tax=Celeribacter litoreus TaxID=2876714 RepID=UPI001CC9CF85|nr:aldose epimerase family protein [Celeribacter litoreus]MCA0042214.1 galactose mutarotase [Celeribacter litoreus]
MTDIFGKLSDGRAIHAVTITDGTLSATILTLGAILNDVRLTGVDHSLTIGSPTLAAYDNGPLKQFGALVGPVANRIAGATAPLDGETLHFPANEGTTCLHSGVAGLHSEVWEIGAQTPQSVTLTCDLPDGKDGFPGNRSITATFSIRAPATLHMEITATTDRTTLMNIANHSYWRLDPAKTTDGHKLQLSANRYLPVDTRLIPLEITPVDGTAFDFRDARIISPSDAQRLDHCFCLSDGSEPLRPVATLTGQSGLTLEMSTTEPGLQVFDAAPMGSGAFEGHEGWVETGFCGVALEAQHWPDAPNRPEFPSVRLGAGDTYHQHTSWRFFRD